jgi:secreted trypsin-like serine protease
MKKFTISLVVFFATFGNLRLEETDPSRIIDGKPIYDISEAPWNVSIRKGPFICGGIIIHEKFILTARHCVNDN